MRVLVLSRYVIVRSALRHMLSANSDVQIVGEAGISEDITDTLSKWHPDVVLIETVEASDPLVVRAIEKIGQAGARLVVLAGHGDPRTIRAMMRSGVTGYVFKSSTDNELILALRSAAVGRKFLDSSLVDALALEDGGPSPSPTNRLSRRQSEVLKYIVEGYTSGGIARKLGLSVKTVETYRARIYEKLEVHSRTALVQYAITAGLISIQDGKS